MYREISCSRALIGPSRGICPMFRCSSALQGDVSHAACWPPSGSIPMRCAQEEMYPMLCGVLPSGESHLVQCPSPRESRHWQHRLRRWRFAAQVSQTGIWQCRFRRQRFAGEVSQTGILVCGPLCLRELCCVYLVLGAIYHRSPDLAGQSDISFSPGWPSLPSFVA